VRATIHYLSAIVILSAYGVQVCPFLESLTPFQLSAPIAVALLIQYALSRLLWAAWVERAPYRHQTRNALAVELGLFVLSGVALTAFNSVVYGFPVGSGLKVIVGLLALGFFAAVDLALEQERILIEHFARTGQQIELDKKYFPVSAKLGAFAAVSVALVVAVVFLVIAKDLEWLKNVGVSVTIEEAQQAILAEVVFVAVVVLAHVMNAIRSYARNLRCFIDNETGVLDAATQGHLDGAVPVSSNDEFGLMAKHTNEMIRSLRARTEELQRTQDVTILSLASLAETRDNETGAHILRTQRYVKVLAEHLAGHPRFSDHLTEGVIDMMYKSAPLHDVGKVGIPDAVLLKPGKLTREEWEIMRRHPLLGANALAVAEKELGESSFLRFAKEIAATHHEKWDGSGYPHGLAGEAIPLSGRLMAVADVYDALITERVYKPAWPHDKAVATIREGRGLHFDPDVVDAFLAVEADIRTIAAEFSDAAYGERHAERPIEQIA
jgi:HD-GYP domain-containing protein (c-di-GMP phosphodiesterase class II)